MIDCLIAGKLHGRPETKTSKAGKPFTTAKVRAATSDADSIFLNVIAFNDAAQAALQALDDGDAVSLAGTVTPKAWTDHNGTSRPSMDMVAAQVLTAYHVSRKRKAMQPDQNGVKAPHRQQVEPDFDDGETPF